MDFFHLKKKQKERSIEDAEVIIVAGRGIKKEEDLSLINGLANLLNAQIATYLQRREKSQDPKHRKEFKDKIEAMAQKRYQKAKVIYANILEVKEAVFEKN